MTHTRRKAGLLAIAVLAVATAGARGASDPRLMLETQFDAVKGQEVEMVVDAPVGTPAVRFFFAGQIKEDWGPPFSFRYETAEIVPRTRNWGAIPLDAAGDVAATGLRGSLDLHPLPKVEDFEVSVLVRAGTPRAVGLVVSNVERNRVVRLWAFNEASPGNMMAVPLRRQRVTATTQVYRFRRGASLHADDNEMLEVEVAPRRLTMVHGVELRGRAHLLWMRENARTGAVLAHRTKRSRCTTRAARSAEDHGRPQSMSCERAASRPLVSLPVHLPG